MEFLLDGIWEGVLLVLRGDPEVMAASWVTVRVSFGATIVAGLIGLPIAWVLASFRFRGRGVAISIIQTLLGVPTVVIGLIVYGLLSRRGPLGFTDVLFSPTAIVVGLVILSIPIVSVFAMTAISSVDQRARETALTLGASSRQVAWAVLCEARFGLVAAILGAFGRVSSEVGIAMMLGGNIKGYTRTLTTGIALESMKGEFGFGIALGVVLMGIIFAVNLGTRILQKS
ncbi:MAG: ABC transporter permease [Nitrospinaceae bacterium]|jgi:tungstate transport system permease protein|nr:ABC transporter permease [Nitrospinaceae bacterium]MBT3434177.1 ABC transporter permease [Nitrospinaceae bacterium]MBT3821008.1 ABC transporter permease [Nitrospinaceae bacterium]MBT4094068.1 ABC transporter permease [Nitrospinaceae bacterium]MBT4432102.1 ABC transporter permease [Nitrospinaceae bacterium]